MSQTKPKIHKLKISNKNPGSISSGMNTVVELDGQKIMATYLKLEFKPRKVTKVVMEIIADVEVEESQFENVKIKS